MDKVVFDTSVLKNTESLNDEQKAYLDTVFNAFADGKQIVSKDGSIEHIYWLMYMVCLELEQTVGEVVSDGSVFIELSKVQGEPIAVSQVILTLDED